MPDDDVVVVVEALDEEDARLAIVAADWGLPVVDGGLDVPGPLDEDASALVLSGLDGDWTVEGL